MYEKLLDSEDSHLAAATATKVLEGSGVMDKRGLQGTIDDSITREELHQTRMLPEFGQGPYEFKRRKPRRMPIRTELQVVPHPLIEVGSDTETDTQLEAVTQKQRPRTKDTQLAPPLFEDETNGKS